MYDTPPRRRAGVPAAGSDRLRSFLLHVAFFASGASALVYEALWLRSFGLLLGATAPATATLLSTLFLGMAIGATLFGRLSARVRRPLALFACLEAGIAIAGPAAEVVLGGLRDRPIGLDSAAPLDSGASLVRMVLIALSILPAAALMGGTFPALAQGIRSADRRLGTLGGGLYAANLLGAAAGVLAVPSVLLPGLGRTGTLVAAAAINLIVAAAAFGLQPRAPAATAMPPAASKVRSTSTPAGLWVAAFGSGAFALALQTLWTRMLALVHESSLPAFATVTATVIAGLALAAAATRRLLARGIGARRLAAWGWMAGGVWVVATPALFFSMTDGLRYADRAGSLPGHLLEIGGLAAVVILPAVLLIGTVLPCLMDLAGPDAERAGPLLGRLLLANLLGAVTGPLAALFFIGPRAGLWGSLVGCGIALLIAGACLLPAAPGRGRPMRRAIATTAAVVLLLALRPASLPPVRLEPGQRLLDLREGPYGAVAVVESSGHRRLAIDNSYVLGGTAAVGEERLQAHLPLLLHPAPRRVAFLGLGTGITAGGALFHPVDEVTTFELVPEVAHSARRFFGDANRGVLDDPRVRDLAADARAGLGAARDHFDVIVGDLVVPWRPAEASLQTLEAFRTARRALRPGGLFCQWLPLFQLSRSEFLSVAAAFLEVFPDTLVWKGDFRAGEPALALVGLTGGPLDPEAVDARTAALSRKPDPVNPYLRHPAGLWVYLAGPLSASDEDIRRAIPNRDERPLVELRSAATQFASRDGGPFVRGPLRDWLDALRARSLDGTPLARLDDAHRRWRDAGGAIWNASLLDLEGDRAGADALGLSGIALLPEPLQQVLRGGAAGPTDR